MMAGKFEANCIYNENAPFPAQWLRNLIEHGHISNGVVRAESISDIKSQDIIDYDRFHTFAGLGAWDYALQLAGWPDDAPVWTGSCPCQPFSVAGKRKGEDDERHLWPEWLRLIAECRPPTIFGEQVASPDGRSWLATVRADLEALGYAVGAADLCAAGVGAPHVRQRLFFVAHATGERRNRISVLRRQGTYVSQTTGAGADNATPWSECEWLPCSDGKQRPVEPGTFPLADGAPGRVEQLRAYGNAIVPQVAAAFIRSVMESHVEINSP